MAEINTPDASVATNASNKTQYFDLPLFIATDKPSWLVDWNGAMNEIDRILNDIATASEGAVADVATIQSQINQLSETVTSLNDVVETAVQDVASMQTTVNSHEARMDTIEGDLITQNNLIKALSTSVTTMQGTVASLNTAVESMQTTLTGYDSRITGAEDAAAAAQTAVAGIQSTVQSLSGTVAGHTSQISNLDGRVMALEQGSTGGNGGFPSVEDLADTSKYTHGTQQVYSENAGNISGTLSAPANSFYVVSLFYKNATGTEHTDDFIEVQTLGYPTGTVGGLSQTLPLSQTTTHAQGINSGLMKTTNGVNLTVSGHLTGTPTSDNQCGAKIDFWTAI